MENDKKLIILVGCGHELYREYLLEQISENYSVWLITDENVNWQDRYIYRYSKVKRMDSHNVKLAIESIRLKNSIGGIVSWDERYIIIAADIAEELNLPGPSSSGIRGCRDKALTRTKLTENALPQPLSKLCHTVEEAEEFASTVGFPVVVKPRGMGGSIGVSQASTALELREKYTEANDSSLIGDEAFKSSVLIEEFVSGEEISIDGALINGEYTPLIIAHKSVGLAPYFEETGHVVSNNDPLFKDKNLLETLQNAHTAIGFDTGITHTEIKLSDKGYVIIEINGRLGGVLIPYLGTLASDIKPGDLAGKLACSDLCIFDSKVPVNKSAAIKFKYPTEKTNIGKLTFPQLTSEDSQIFYQQIAPVGTLLGLPPETHMGRAAYVIVVSNSESDALSLSEKYCNEIKLTQ